MSTQTDLLDDIRASAARQESDRWNEELQAAGWTRIHTVIWKSPSGDLHYGPFAAWRTMKMEEHAREHRSARYGFEFVNGDVLFTDEHGSVWRVTPTGFPDMPLTITKVAT